MAKNLLEAFENKYMEENKRNFPNFKAGDTIIVKVKVLDGMNARVQNYQGLVIAVKNRGLGSSFVVRKESHGENVERNFLKYSPIIDGIELVKRGRVRRAKLYYMRELKGKAARIKEDTRKSVLKSAAKAAAK